MTRLYFIPSLLLVFAGCGADGADAEEPSLTQNAVCERAQPLALVDRTVTLKSTTEGAEDEYEGSVACGLNVSRFDGPQRYYSFAAKAGNTYKISVEATYDGAAFYVFAGSCGAQSINTDCASGGVRGLEQRSGIGPMVATLVAPESGTLTVGIDSIFNGAGSFSLTILEMP